MGWWGYGTLDGDGPLDIVDDVGQMLGQGLDLRIGQTLDERAAAAVRATFDGVELRTVDHLVEKLTTSEPREVTWQVLAALAMAAGAELHEDVRARMLHAAGNDPLVGWDRAEARRDAMAQLCADLTAYDGTPIPLRAGPR